jgi:hypothetical protein
VEEVGMRTVKESEGSDWGLQTKMYVSAQKEEIEVQRWTNGSP